MNYFPKIYLKKKIGLFGGSFDPPHSGHLDISINSEKKFGLNLIVWLVNNQNPLKNKKPKPIEKRLLLCRHLTKNHNIIVSDIEAKIKSKYSKDFLKKLLSSNPKMKFIWLMGSDNFCNFDSWKDWTWIMENIPVAVISRPGTNVKASFSKAGIKYKKYRIKEKKSQKLINLSSPVWILINGQKNYLSSTKIRKSKKNESK